MANHWKCKKCGSMNIERKFAKRFGAEATLYEDEQGKFNEDDVGFGTQEEETLNSFLFCKDCREIGEYNNDNLKFELMPDKD